MYMSEKDLESARALMEHFKKADQDSPVYGIGLFLEKLIQRGDDYQQALQNMWDVVAICEPNTLGDRVYRHLLQGRALKEAKDQRDLAIEELKKTRKLILELHVDDASAKLSLKLALVSIEAAISSTLEALEKRIPLLEATPPEKQE